MFLLFADRESRLGSCADMICDNSRKALFKDLDGTALGLAPPASVFPKSEFEREQPCLDTGKSQATNRAVLLRYMISPRDRSVQSIELFVFNGSFHFGH